MYCWMVLTHSSAYSWLDTKSVQVVPSFRLLFLFLFSIFKFIFCLSVECLCCVYICVWFLKDFIKKKKKEKQTQTVTSVLLLVMKYGCGPK